MPKNNNIQKDIIKILNNTINYYIYTIGPLIDMDAIPYNIRSIYYTKLQPIIGKYHIKQKIHYQIVVDIYPNTYHDYYYMMGGVMIYNKNIDDWLQPYKQKLGIEPQNKKMAQILAYMLMINGKIRIRY